MTGHEPINLFLAYLGEDGSRAHKYWNFSGAWCCGEVAMVMKQTTGNLFYDGKKVVYCPTAYAWCKTHLQKIPTRNAQYGDIIFYDWNKNGVPDHIGMVEYVEGTTVHALEGNTGSPARVRGRVRASYILGIFRPKYEPAKPEDYLVQVDGEWGYHTCLGTQYVLNCTPLDGVLGKATVKAIQKKVGTKVDGGWGSGTTLAMQKFLNANGITDMNGNKLVEDGERGKATISAWQKWINAQIKGEDPTPTPEPEPTPESSGYPGTFPSIAVYKTSAQAIQDALNWGRAISKDNDFHYGEYGRAKHKGEKIYNVTHRSGCHFCNTNHSKKVVKANALGYKGENWERSYVCNTFVTACYAHGAMESVCLTKCRKGSCIGMNDKGRSPALDNSKNWKYLGKLPIKDLKAGDILVSEPHMQMVYAPVSSTKVQICEACSYEGKYHSKASDGSIRISTKKPSYTSVYRFIGTVQGNIPIRHGEYSERVKQLQAFLNWYFGKTVCDVDGFVGDSTLKYIKQFQSENGLTDDGEFGTGSLAKAKEIKK